MGMKIDKLLDQICLNTIVSFGGTKKIIIINTQDRVLLLDSTVQSHE